MLDFRSDVLASPPDRIWQAMRSASTGWATFGEDALVAQLERRVANLLGKQAAAFFPTCSMANLAALLALGERGSQVVLGASAHIATSESWGFVTYGGLVPCLLPDSDSGAMDPRAVGSSIEATRARRLARTSVVCLENTHTNSGGIAVTAAAIQELANVAHERGAAVHLDGARLLNAAAALNETPARLAESAETVAMSLNKGLGPPYGAVLAGDGATVERALQERRRLGGASVHQAGLFAAAALLALEDWRPRLSKAQAQAKHLASGLARIPGLRIVPESYDPTRQVSNIVLVDLESSGWDPDVFSAQIEARGLRGMRVGPRRIRFVTHAGIADEGVEQLIEAAVAVASTLTDRTSGSDKRHVNAQ